MADFVGLGRIAARPISKSVPVKLVQVLGKLRLPQRQLLRTAWFADHSRQERYRGRQVQLGQRQPLGIEVVERERRIGVNHDGGFAQRLGETLVGQTLLDEERMREMIRRLEQQVLDKGRLASSGHAEEHRVLRRTSGGGTHPDQVAVTAVVERLGIGESPGKGRRKREHIR